MGLPPRGDQVDQGHRVSSGLPNTTAARAFASVLLFIEAKSYSLLPSNSGVSFYKISFCYFKYAYVCMGSVETGVCL